LSDKQTLQLRSFIVGRDPRQFSFGVALWTRKVVRDLIRQRFDVQVSLPTVGRILTKLGLSAQRALYRAYQQNPELVRQWKTKVYPGIRARAAEVGATIFFADEAGIRTDHHAGTTWAPVGGTPVVAATGECKSVTMISAVSARGEIHFDVFLGTVNAGCFIKFCEELLHDTTTPVFLIVDGATAHTANVVKEYVVVHPRAIKPILPPALFARTQSGRVDMEEREARPSQTSRPHGTASSVRARSQGTAAPAGNTEDREEVLRGSLSRLDSQLILGRLDESPETSNPS
jgi:hypothetical protein